MWFDQRAWARARKLPAWAIRWAIRWAVPLACAILVIVQLRADFRLFPSWIGWSDQDYYLQAARAWAAWSLDPSQHHYPPGYALLAAPFVYLTPSQPFLLPDLACSVAALVLFTRVARRLSPHMPHAEAVAALCFLACTAIGQTAVSLWVIPWTTTAAAPLLLACLLFALRFDQSGAPRELAALGFFAGLCAMVRPSDAALVFIVCAGFSALRLLIARPGRSATLRGGGFLAAGLCLGILPGAAAHYMVHGFSAGGYVGGSAAVGFEWRLIPLRWVTLVICPRPLFSQGTGMEAVFPWILPGIAGMALAVFYGSPRMAANALAACAICLYWALYLSYRDLHAYGLWRYNNVHYFKWTLPFLAFWTVDLAVQLRAGQARRSAMLALAAAALLFCWRPEFLPVSHGVAQTSRGQVDLPGGLSPITHAYTLQAAGDWHAAYFNRATLVAGGQDFISTRDFRLFPVASRLLIMPLRKLPPGNATLTAPDGVWLPAQADWVAGTVALVFGLPCLVTPRLGDCRPGSIDLPPRPRVPG